MATSLNYVEGIIDKIRQLPVSLWKRACVVILSLWLVYSLSQLFWIVMPEPEIPSPSLEVATNTAFADRPTQSVSVDIAAIKDLPLFGDESATPVEPVKVQPTGIESEAVDTRLKLKLVGTVASSDESLGKAFIADGAKQDTFGPDEELTIGPSGVKIAKVLVDRVILDNNGRYETLWLYQGKEDFVRSGRPTVSRTSSRPPRPRRPERRLQDGSGDASAIEDARDLVGSVLPVNGGNPTEKQIKTINELVNVNMHREGGAFIGFKINPKRDSQLFDELGLKPNDIVTAVNNTPLDSTNRAMQVYRSLSTSSQATLEILRDGNTVSVDINLQ